MIWTQFLPIASYAMFLAVAYGDRQAVRYEIIIIANHIDRITNADKAQADVRIVRGL